MSKGNANRKFELIWRGRLHLGDEPGVYGDAQYTGLCTEWPITLRKFDPTSEAGGTVTFQIDSEDVAVFTGYPGHKVTVSRYVQDPSPENPFKWKRLPPTPEDEHRLKEKTLDLDVTVPGGFATVYVSIRVEVDTDVNPGLYDDFVLTRLSMYSENFYYYADLGFIYERNPATDT